MSLLRPRKRPCSTCPYRRDVPSGLWDESEYAKLPGYDGDIPEQLTAGATQPFMCHQQDGSLCAGWVGCHDMDNTLAVRLGHRRIDVVAVQNYRSPVPLFSSGREAAEHGMRDIGSPGPAAQKKISQLLAMAARRARR